MTKSCTTSFTVEATLEDDPSLETLQAHLKHYCTRIKSI